MLAVVAIRRLPRAPDNGYVGPVGRLAAWISDPGTPLPPWAHQAVTPADLARLGELYGSTGWRVDLGVTLGHPDAAAAASEAAAAVKWIGAGLDTIQIGNEPDLFAGD